MTQAKPIISFFLAIFLTSNVYGYIDAAINIKLWGGQELIVIFDAYEGYSREKNQINAVTIAYATKTLANRFPEQKIHFSYEDPAVYDAGSSLIEKLLPLKPLLKDISDEKFLTLVAPVSGLPRFDALLFTRPAKLSTFLTGDLTHVLSSLPGNFWPTNLTIHSNDPRHEHMQALAKSKQWLLQHQNTLRMRNLITASPLLKAKRELFAIDQDLDPFSQEKILSFIKGFAETENAQLASFANFSSIKAGEQIEVSDLEKNIGKLLPKISLDTVYEFLKNTKDRNDIYADGPIVDILLTLFNQNHPDKTVVILGNHLATRLVKTLDEMGVIISGDDIENAVNYITRLAQESM